MLTNETRYASSEAASSGTALILFLLSFVVSIGLFAGLMIFFNVALNHQRNIRRSRKSASSPVTKHLESIGTAVIIPYRDHPFDLESQVSHEVSPIDYLPSPLVSLSPLVSVTYNDTEGNGIAGSTAAVDVSGNNSTLKPDGESIIYL